MAVGDALRAEMPRDPTNPWAPSPFRRLARTHAASVAGDAVFTAAIAGLVFFSVSNLDQARWQVALALVFTFAPFAIAGPWIGPLIDRAPGGRRWMIVGLAFGRFLLCLLLVVDRSNSWLLYPEVLLVLVFSKAYVIAKGAVVPSTVHGDHELIEANAKLSALSGLAAAAGAVPALALMWLVSRAAEGRGPDAALILAAGVYLAATVFALQLPRVRVAGAPAGEAERVELRAATIRHAAVATGVTSAITGFLLFLLAFYFKGIDSKAGLVLSAAAGQIGFLAGSAISPAGRRVLREEQLLAVAGGVTAVAGVLTSVMNPIAGAVVVAFGVGLASNVAKQAFDALVQRDAPDANRGRAFARFETRFQLLWVVGALVPCFVEIPPSAGFLLVGATGAAATVWYLLGLRRARAEANRRPSPLAGEPELIEPAPASRAFLRGSRRPAPVAVQVEPVFADPDVTMPAPLLDEPTGGLFAAGADVVDTEAPGAVVDPSLALTDAEGRYGEPQWADPDPPRR